MKYPTRPVGRPSAHDSALRTEILISSMMGVVEGRKSAVRCDVASAAEVRRAEADRSDAGRNGRMTLSDAGFARCFALAGGARTRHVGTRSPFALLLEAGLLVAKGPGYGRGRPCGS